MSTTPFQRTGWLTEFILVASRRLDGGRNFYDGFPGVWKAAEISTAPFWTLGSLSEDLRWLRER